ncbi:MAG: hypothetical protein K5989_09590 [Lachnospiraceae bacterium]|nr:hypothetical protein [Lachnospiraceae bacterium]
MTIEEYMALSMEEKRKYDFTEDWRLESEQEKAAFTHYKDMSSWEKYFVYKKAFGGKPNGVFKEAVGFFNIVKGKYGSYMIDPDTYSSLMQGLYRKLWTRDSLEFCEDKGRIHGDTMNSITTSMSWFVRYVFEEDPNYYGSSEIGNGFIGDKGDKADGSLNQSLEIYLREKDRFERDEIFQQAKDFIRINHTLGNFLPVPYREKGGQFNVPRAKSSNDYWDLTLYYLYSCYESIKDMEVKEIKASIESICKGELLKDNLGRLLGYNYSNVRLCLEWLCCFAKDQKPCWDVFVERNFLQPYVKRNNEDRYGMPKLLWSNNEKVLQEAEGILWEDMDDKEMEGLWAERLKNNKPKGIAPCNMFFVNVRKCIEERTDRMLKEM